MAISIEIKEDRIYKNGYIIAVLTICGFWPTGSMADQETRYLYDSIFKILENEKITKYIIDMTSLKYIFGNSILSFILGALKKENKFQYAIIAFGETEKNIKLLLDNSNIRFGLVGIYQSIEQGIDALIY